MKLVISVSGIGNTLMATPLIKELAKNKSVVCVLVGNKPSAEILKQNFDVKETFVMDRGYTFSNIRLLFQLRKIGFDESYMIFPANRWFFNLISFIVGAKKRFAHNYPNKRFTSLFFLNNKRVDMKEVHDVEQNLSLLKNYKLNNKKDINLVLKIKQIKPKKIKGLVGIHPGSSTDSDMEMKRWPEKYYAQLINKLKIPVRVFIGPDEERSYEELKSHLKRPVEEIRENSIIKVAEKISQCEKFVANDSGLMHIASTLGIPVVAIFGPTEPRRNAPYKGKSKVLFHKMHCQPCSHNFKNLGTKTKCIYSKRYCLTRLGPDTVLKAIEELK